MAAFKTQLIADKYYSICFVGQDIFTDKSSFNFTSSYHVLGARLLGLSYPDYLTYCQSTGARLRGRNGYTYPVWESNAAAQSVMKKLEKQWSLLTKEIKF